MDIDEARAWLGAKSEMLESFMDYEIYFEESAELIENLGYWFGDSTWEQSSVTFHHLGADGTGSFFAAWERDASDEIPVVFFGSEGSFGVMTKEIEPFIRVLAFGPSVDEEFDGSPSSLSVGYTWLDSLESEGEEEYYKEGKRQRDAYRVAVSEKFGKMPTFESLTVDLDLLNAEFRVFVENARKGNSSV